jgi:hypothetical protein
MVQFGMKTEPNQTELFAKFKISELNCLHFELNCFKVTDLMGCQRVSVSVVSSVYFGA